MSYRNPAIIKDTSGELYGQAAANVGRSLARGMEMAGSRREQQRKQADADRKRTQQIGYGIQSKAYESRNKVYTELLKKEPGLAEQFKEQTEALLMGNDEIGMGAIEARTILATGQNLDMKEKQRLQEVINRYEVFQSGLQGNAGKIQAEVQLYQSTSPGEFDDKYRWAGSNEFERTTSQLAASALANEEIPGARYEKKLYTPTSNGEQVVGIKIYVDPNNPSNKGKYDNEEVYPRNENGEIELEWKKDLNKWDEGLLEEIVASPDSISMFKNAGITDKNNGWSENQFLDLKGKSRPIKGLNGKNMTVISRDLNVPGWLDNDVLQDEIKSKAEGFQDMGDSDLASFMSVKMKVGGFNITEFREKTREEQLFEIEKELNEDFIIQKTGGLGKREASSDEPGAVIDPLNPIKEVDGEEVENFVIYSQDSKPVITNQKTPPAKTYDFTGKAKSFMNEFNADPAKRLNAIPALNTRFPNARMSDNMLIIGDKTVDKDEDGEPDVYEELDMNDPEVSQRVATEIMENDPTIKDLPTAQKSQVKEAIMSSLKSSFKTNDDNADNSGGTGAGSFALSNDEGLKTLTSDLTKFSTGNDFATVAKKGLEDGGRMSTILETFKTQNDLPKEYTKLQTITAIIALENAKDDNCLLYTSPSPRDS